MKGIVFTEFLEMVDDKFSPDIAEAIIEEANLPSGGAYTSVATYDHAEMVAMVVKLAEKTNTPVSALLGVFGEYLLGRFCALYPDFFEGINNTYDFLDTIENHVHVEVRKLYSDAELPTFKTERQDSGAMVMTYQSKRPFADLAEGLIRGSIAHFGEDITLTREDLGEGDGSYAAFHLEKAA